MYEPLSFFLEGLIQGFQANTTAWLPKQHQGIGMLLTRIAGHCIGMVGLACLH